MTEEERIREVEQISRRTKESVKIPPDQQRIIRIVRFRERKTGNLYRNAGRCHSKCKTNGRTLRTDRTHRIKKTHVTQIHEPG